MNNEINGQEANMEAKPASKENNLISLMSALLNGEVLQKVHPIGEVEYFWCEKNKGQHYFYTHGWGSALGTAKDRLFDVIDNPEQWSVKPNTSSQALAKEQEEKYYPGIQYQRLFNAISETKGIPTQSEMDEIIRIVHEDFPKLNVEQNVAEGGKEVSQEKLDSSTGDGQQNPSQLKEATINPVTELLKGIAVVKGVNPDLVNRSLRPEVTPQMKIAKEALEIHNKEWQGLLNKTSNSEATILSAEEVLKKHFKPAHIDDLMNAVSSYGRLGDLIIAAMEEYHNQFK